MATAPLTENTDPVINQVQKKFESIVAELQQQFAQEMQAYSEEEKKETDKHAEEMKKDQIWARGHLETRQHKFVMGIPEVEMEDKEFTFDVPVIEMQRKDIKMDVPALVMKRVRGPDIPKSKLEWTNDGPFGTPSPTWRHWVEPSYFDQPTMEWRTEGYSFDVPTAVRMEKQKFIMSVPRVTVRDRELSFDYPVFIVEEWEIDLSGEKKKEHQDAIDAKVAAGKQWREERTKKLNAALGEAFLFLAPATLMSAANLASQGFASQAEPLRKRNEELYPKLAELINAGVHPGDPKRQAIEPEFQMNRMQLQILAGAANKSMYEAWNGALKSLTDAPSYGLTKEQILQRLAESNAASPPMVSWGDA